LIDLLEAGKVSCDLFEGRDIIVLLCAGRVSRQVKLPLLITKLLAIALYILILVEAVRLFPLSLVLSIKGCDASSFSLVLLHLYSLES
jgi:hypothetical protein